VPNQLALQLQPPSCCAFQPFQVSLFICCEPEVFFPLEMLPQGLEAQGSTESECQTWMGPNNSMIQKEWPSFPGGKGLCLSGQPSCLWSLCSGTGLLVEEGPLSSGVPILNVYKQSPAKKLHLHCGDLLSMSQGRWLSTHRSLNTLLWLWRCFYPEAGHWLHPRRAKSSGVKDMCTQQCEESLG
jgi:hypothetical protein